MNMTLDEIFTEMTMSTSYVMHIVVEGETDAKFILSLINNHPGVNIIPAAGADNVISLMEKIDAENPELRKPLQVFGIIDRDYRIPLKTTPNSVNVLITDKRDLECMMFSSPALGHVLNELGSRNKVQAFGGEAAIRDHVVSLCSKVGEIRFFSQANGRNISFKNLNYQKFATDDLLFDASRFIQHINGSQPQGVQPLQHGCLIQASTACSAAQNTVNELYFDCRFKLSRGHDLISVLGIGLRKVWGSKKAAEITPDILGSSFRLAYIQFFKTSDLYQKIVQWLGGRNLDFILRT